MTFISAGPWEQPKIVWQPPCPCCNYTMNEKDSCVMFEDSDPSQRCDMEGCICWGGPDHECEDCWLWLK